MRMYEIDSRSRKAWRNAYTLLKIIPMIILVAF